MPSSSNSSNGNILTKDMFLQVCPLQVIPQWKHPYRRHVSSSMPSSSNSSNGNILTEDMFFSSMPSSSNSSNGNILTQDMFLLVCPLQVIPPMETSLQKTCFF